VIVCGLIVGVKYDDDRVGVAYAGLHGEPASGRIAPYDCGVDLAERI